MEPVSRILDAAGPLFSQEWRGPDDGPVFVCIHGLGGTHLNFMRLAPLLAQRGRVLVPDLPGCGLTPRSGRRTGIASARRSLAELIRQEVGRPVILVGNSMGGATSVVLAATEPDLVSGVVLCGPALPPREDPPALVRSLAGAYGLVLGSDLVGRARVRVLTPEHYVALGFRAVLADPRAQPPEVVAAHTEMMRRVQADPDAARSFAEAARSVFAFLLNRKSGLYLDWVRCPVLLLQGGKDRVVPAGMVLATAPGDWTIHLWPDLGHLVQLEDPERTCAAIGSWLDAHQVG